MGNPAIAAGFSLSKSPCAALSSLDVALLRLRSSALPMKICSALYRIHLCIPQNFTGEEILGILRNVKCFALCVKDSKLAFSSLRLPKKVRSAAY